MEKTYRSLSSSSDTEISNQI
ncbi:unnamed protein product, partial [Rotaria magnacalcarata]